MVQKEEKQKKQATQRIKKRKTVDKWKSKKWFAVLAPPAFKNKHLAYTPGADEETVIGRILTINGRELTGNIKKGQLMLRFKINGIQGLNAQTVFEGLGAQSSALKRIVRRRSSKIESVDNVVCKDGMRARAKTLVLTVNKISRVQRTAIRKIIKEEINQIAGKYDYEGLLTHIVTEDATATIVQRARKISPIKRAEVLKTIKI